MKSTAGFPNVEKSVEEYLEYGSMDRRALARALSLLCERLPRLVIFGGMLREFALGRARSFVSDIDLVATASSEELFQAAAEFSPSRNKFGGLRFYVNKWRFDIWSFEETWAFKRGLVAGEELTDLFDTTFFNIDAAFYDCHERSLYASDLYKTGIASRLLEVNLKSNPSPRSMALKAIRLAVDRDLAVGPELAEFILQHSGDLELRGLYLSFVRHLYCHCQTRHYSAFKFEAQPGMNM